VGQLGGNLRLINEHPDGLIVVHEMRQEALDGDDALEAPGARVLGEPHLGHAADADAVREKESPKGLGWRWGYGFTVNAVE
jgi:hypothetical protein